MADAQRGQFVIDCKSGEAAYIIYGLVHDKTLFRPELDLANAHPTEFDNEHIFPLDMFINSDYRKRRKTPCFSYGDIRRSETKFLLKG